jgi:hypothetical protein
MKNRMLQSIAVSALVLGVAAVPSFAEGFNQIKVTVPFAFRAGNVTLPAGQYEVVEEGPAGLLLIEGRKGAAMMIAGPAQDSVAGSPEMTFERTGHEAVLTGVRLGGELRSLRFSH